MHLKWLPRRRSCSCQMAQNQTAHSVLGRTTSLQCPDCFLFAFGLVIASHLGQNTLQNSSWRVKDWSSLLCRAEFLNRSIFWSVFCFNSVFVFLRDSAKFFARVHDYHLTVAVLIILEGSAANTRQRVESSSISDKENENMWLLPWFYAMNSTPRAHVVGAKTAQQQTFTSLFPDRERVCK